MRKLFTLLLATITTVTILSVKAPPAEAQSYCSSCCDWDPWGNPRVRCVLSSPGLCGYACYCNGIPGTGFAC